MIWWILSRTLCISTWSVLHLNCKRLSVSLSFWRLLSHSICQFEISLHYLIFKLYFHVIPMLLTEMLKCEQSKSKAFDWNHRLRFKSYGWEIFYRQMIDSWLVFTWINAQECSKGISLISLVYWLICRLLIVFVYKTNCNCLIKVDVS